MTKSAHLPAHAEGKSADYLVRAASCHAMRAVGWPLGFDPMAIWPGFLHDFTELSPAEDLAMAEVLIAAAKAAI